VVNDTELVQQVVLEGSPHGLEYLKGILRVI